MGKRSNFERREADFYPTPRAAVLPLIPYLRGIRTFAEPCAGDGALVRHLVSFGFRCVYSDDIRNGQDALAVDTWTVWRATSPDLQAVLKREGAALVCPKLGTRYPAAA